MSRARSSAGWLALLAACAGCDDGALTGASDAGVADAAIDRPDANVDAGALDATPLPDAATLPDAGSMLTSGVLVSFAADLPPAVVDRLRRHLVAAAPALVEVPADAEPPLADGALHLVFGTSPGATALGLGAAARALGPDAIVLDEATLAHGRRLYAVGAPGEPRAAGYAAYALLEALGFAFLHPLAPLRPTSLVAPTAPLHVREGPRWPTRIMHLHTQHPLELTELLQGWGPGGPDDAAGWEAMLPEWERYLEWLLANRQTGVEWFLLWASTWSDFADGPARQARLGRLVDRVHAFALEAGLDVPIVFAQQHAFRLLRAQRSDDEPAELAEIDAHLDWVLSSGFDFLDIESGTSEFTAPDPQRMLDWMNEVTRHAATRWGARTWVKAHASTGQVAHGFIDPATGQDINFNFLPHFADPQLGVLPHTVEPYGLTDPAPTYGNHDFGYLRDFLRRETGVRPVLFYPETAYWVSVDIDVPLFLPLYAERRLEDLRLLADDEDQNRMAVPGARMDGQLVFSSGWEWGYWLNDVVAARSAWDPHVPLDDDAAFVAALAPITRTFGAAADDVAAWLLDTVHAEHELLILGRFGPAAPADVTQRNGLGYLAGWDTWDDLAKLTGALPMTQPDRLGLVDMRNPLHGGPGYSAEVDPLLAAMEMTFGALAFRGDALRARIPAGARDLFDDLADAAQVTALRARQIHGLYRYVDGYWDLDQAPRRAALADARGALDEAAPIVAAREARYRVPAARIAAWSANPTAYAFRYLWMVHSLYAWWRDEGKAVDAPLFPCYLNVINPVDVAFGEGFGTDAVRFVGDFLSSDQQRGCLAEPSAEPRYPQDGLRSRP